MIFLIFISSIGLAQEIPTLQKYVNDFANVLPSSDESRINTLCTEIEKNWTVEIAVLTVQTTQPMSIEEYAVRTFEKNGIGKKDKDNGLLIVAAMEDRKWRLEVGYGLEPIINDAKAGLIGNTYITPAFKEGRYGDGLYYAVDAVRKVIQSGGDTSFISEQADSEVFTWMAIVILIFVFIPFFLFIISALSTPKCPRCKTKMKCYYKGDYLICDCPKCGKRMKSAGRGKGYKCLKCKYRDQDTSRIETALVRDLHKGLYLPPTRAQRHLTRPTARIGKKNIGAPESL